MSNNSDAHSPSGWESFVRHLRRDYDTDSRHFAIHVLRRNPDDDRGAENSVVAGVHGLRDRGLLDCYVAALETAYDRFLNAGWPVPRMHPEEGIPVYIFSVDDTAGDGHLIGSAFMTEISFFRNREGGPRLPVICLPSRFAVIDKLRENSHAQAIAAHELAHVFISTFCSLTPPPGAVMRLDQIEKWYGSWLWLNEGTAVSTEARFFPLNLNWLDCALEWLDRPERSLDDPQMKYQSVMFVRYLLRWIAAKGINDDRFLVNLWKRSESVWSTKPTDRCSAIGALVAELAEHDIQFVSPSNPDLFASGYCFDSYFFETPNHPAFEPEVAGRWAGGRAVKSTWRLSKKRWKVRDESDNDLPSLACRYFRLIPEGVDVGTVLRIRIIAQIGHQLKAEAALVLTDAPHFRCGPRVSATRVTSANEESLELTVNEFSPATCNHVVLVVTNCAINGDTKFGPFRAWPNPVINFAVEAQLASE